MRAPPPHRSWLLAVLAAAALASPALAAEEPRPLSQAIRERWTYRDGLPHNVVHRLLAARSGYLWIGTQEGLVRFDGVRFKVFTAAGTPGLAGNEITALREDEPGVLWIGTSLGLSRLTGDVFERVDLGGDAAVTDVAPDGEGGVWVATEASGVRRVRAGAQGRTEQLPGLPDLRVLALARHGDELWIGGFGGISRLAGGRLEHLGHAGLPAAPVIRIVVSRDGTIWASTGAGLARRPPGAQAFERSPLTGDRYVGGLFEDREGELWFGSEGAPVTRVRAGRAEVVAGRLAPAGAQAFAEDGEGNLWIGTESAGLYRLRWGQVVTVASEEGLSADVSWAVHGSRDGGLWVATDAGLDRVAEGRAEPRYARELQGQAPGGLLEDRAGRLWVGTSTGLLRFGPGREVARMGRESGLEGSLTRTFHEGADGVIWVGTSHGVFRLAEGRFRALVSDPGLAGDKVNVLEEAPGGGLWVGTTTGLARVQGERLVPAEVGGQYLRSDVTALLADPDGALWIGTVGDGLLRLAQGRLDRWTPREGLHEVTVFAILDDGAGNLWLGGSHGITRVSRASLEEVAAGRGTGVAAMTFGTADGMRERECSGGVTPAAWRATDGTLWFATIHGVVAIDPTRAEASPAPPPVRIEELVADAHPRGPGAALRLAPGTRKVEVRYTGLALAAAERIRFRHRLLGLDEVFVEAGPERVAHYTNLGPGRYVFEVQAANGSGAWSAPATLTFELDPHPWQTRWFALLVVGVVGVLAVGGPVLRIRALRAREATLAARVEEEVRKVRVLKGLLPTCAWCSKIRDESGRWHQFEVYVSAHTDVEFTHGMCPDCYARGEREDPGA